MSYKVKKNVKYIDVVKKGDKQEIVTRQAKIINPNYYVQRKEEIFKMIDEMQREMYDNLKAHIGERVVAELNLLEIPTTQSGILNAVAVDDKDQEDTLTIGKQVYPFNSDSCTVLTVTSLDTKERIYDISGLERTNRGR